MKRRNAECGKLRRPLKRNKISEGIYTSIVLYLKFLTLWAIVLVADFVCEFRFEYLWPFWLLLRSVYDSFKYQGLAFSVFFICVAASSDMICFFFIPAHWLFFLASTYVWVQYVWHTERGICLSTIIICLLFVYIEAAIRLKYSKLLPFHMDLCRPFAAHCIGYPVVTFGFGFKSYVGYRMRQRKQREVAKENEFYMQLLHQALPAQPEAPTTPPSTTNVPSPDKIKVPSSENDSKLSNGYIINNTVPLTHNNNNSNSCNNTSSSVINKNNHRKSLEKEKLIETAAEKKNSHSHTNGTINHQHNDYIERINCVNNDLNVNEVDKSNTKVCYNNNKSGGKWTSSNNKSSVDKEKRNRSNREMQQQQTNVVQQQQQQQQQQHETNKDEYLQRLEGDVRRLKIDLQVSRQTEQELRSQLTQLTNHEKSTKNEMSQLQHHNEDLQTRLHGLVTARQQDKQNVIQLEKKLCEERRMRCSLENQLTAERKAKKVDEAAATARALALAAAQAKLECTESCKSRRREMEVECKQLRREVKLKDDRLMNTERELQTLRQHNESDILMSALSAMQDKNAHLENSLSAETRIKLDLFSALGEAKRLLEIRDALIQSQEKELTELKGKMAQVLAVMPSETFCSSPSPVSSSSSKFRLSDNHLRYDHLSTVNSLRELTESPVSTLDPNATAYTPKSTTLVTSTEA